MQSRKCSFMTPESLRKARLELRREQLRTCTRSFSGTEHRPVSRAELAKELGTNYHSLWRLEVGEGKITRALAYAMAAIKHGLPPLE